MNNVHFNLIKKIVDNKVDYILDNQIISSGHNGPYYDKETVGRNISHWIVTCSLFWENTGDEKYYDAVKKLSEYYYSGNDLMKNNTYKCRTKNNKDHINGTIGQAWIIEGLIAAAKTLKDDKLYNLAIKVFKSQKFDWENGMWKRIEIDGRNLGFDLTYNHQLWFAAAGCQIIDYKYDEEIDNQIKCFLDRSNKTFRVMYNGLIYHFATPSTNIIATLKNNIKYIKHNIEIIFNLKSLEYKEIGYHLFNIYGFALLQDRYSREKIFNTKKFKLALEFSFKESFIKALEDSQKYSDISGLICDNVKSNMNVYAYPYNSPAFEMPYIMKKFNRNNNIICERMMNFQINNTYDHESLMFKNNTEDSSTLNSRIYELVRALF